MGKTDIRLTESKVLKLKVCKKRAQNLDLQQNVVRKRKRNSAEHYVSTSGYPVPGKIPTIENKKCTNNCQKEGCLYSLETKQQIFREFYSSQDYDQQTTFLLSHISRSLPQENVMRQNNVFRYYLPSDGFKAEVCVQTFTDVLKISRKRVRVIHQKLAQGILIGNDLRGKHNNRANRLDAFTLHQINSHISAYPTQLSHYKRNEGDPVQQYLPAGLNLSKMFRQFVAENENFVRAPFLWNAYRTEFKKTGLKFAKLRSDTCSQCEKFFVASISAPNEDIRNQIQQESEVHHYAADSAYRKMNGDIRFASEHRNDVTVLCVDMQQVLFTPTLEHKDMFYLRQYSTYNFCVYDAGRDDPTMFMWTESVATKGSEELLSCLWRWVRENVPPLQVNQQRHLIIWSDRCYGQNNNYITLVFGKMLIARRFYTSFEQKFLISGHSFLSCDRLFALIEIQKKICKAYVPNEWVDILLNSRPSKPFEVRVMALEHFLAFDDMLQFVPRPRSLKVSQAMWIRMEVERPSIILTKVSHNEDCQFQEHIVRQPFNVGIMIEDRAEWEHFWLDDTFVLQQKNTLLLPIDAQKFRDLLRMMEFILPQYRDFYLNLPHL